MKTFVIGLLLTGLIGLTNVATADLLPPSTRVDIGTQSNPDVRACFDLTNYKSLLHMAVDLGAALKRQEVFQEDLKVKEQIISNLGKKIVLQSEVIEAYRADHKRLLAKWTEENRLRHEAERPRIGSWLGYGLAGGFAISTVVLGAILVLD